MSNAMKVARNRSARRGTDAPVDVSEALDDLREQIHELEVLITVVAEQVGELPVKAGDRRLARAQGLAWLAARLATSAVEAADKITARLAGSAS